MNKPFESAQLHVLLEKFVSTGSAGGTAVLKVIPVQKAKSGAVFNIDEFMRRNCGDLELARDVAAIFIGHRPEYTTSIRSAVAAGDDVELRRAAHKLKGAAINLALPLLAEATGAIESVASAGDLEKAEQLLPELELQFERGVEAIHEQLLSLLEKGTDH